MVTYLPYVIYYYILHGDKPIDLPDPNRDTKSWVIFSKVHITSSVTCQAVSTWLTVYLVVFRYYRIRTISLESQYEAFKRKYSFVFLVISFIFVLSILLNLPVFLYSSIKEGNLTLTYGSNETLGQYEPLKFYYIEQSDLNIKTNGLTFKLMFYIHAILFKFIPCIILTIYTCLLVNLIRIKNKKLKHVFGLSKSKSISSSNQAKATFKTTTLKASSMSKIIKETRESEEITDNEIKNIKNNQCRVGMQEMVHRDSKKVTFKQQAKVKNWHIIFLLIIMCLFFVMTEFPQSILLFLSIILDDWFYNDVYLPLGDLMDMFALVNNSFTFILYCSMSSEFRKTFVFMFKKKNTK